MPLSINLNAAMPGATTILGRLTASTTETVTITMAIE